MKARFIPLPLGVFLLCAGTGAAPPAPADSGWQVSLEDAFDRAELGGDWDV